MEIDSRVYPTTEKAAETTPIQQEGNHQCHLLFGTKRLHLENAAQGNATLEIGLLLLRSLAKRGDLASHARLPTPPRAGEAQ